MKTKIVKPKRQPGPKPATHFTLPGRKPVRWMDSKKVPMKELLGNLI